MNKRILAFSSSREGNGTYLETAAPVIENFLGKEQLNIAFIPFASVDTNYENYTSKVKAALKITPYIIHTANTTNAASVIDKADAIMVGGGNTFKLLHDLYSLEILEIIKEKINTGTPFIGWSAGSNITGATICTSNDMPIINPGNFTALSFFPFQINPHYYNQPISGFNGETRDQRLAEFLQLNPSKKIIALPEGTALLLENNQLKIIGISNALLFKWANNTSEKYDLIADSDISHLLEG